jgi:glutamine---fructose-6-phosphate transaminase (isomerizing)
MTEHNAFRNNQIREGKIILEEALTLVEDENRPWYQNIRWCLDSFSENFKGVISIASKIRPIHKL